MSRTCPDCGEMIGVPTEIVKQARERADALERGDTYHDEGCLYAELSFPLEAAQYCDCKRTAVTEAIAFLRSLSGDK